MNAEPEPASTEQARIDPVLRHGNGVARPLHGSGARFVLVPFTLPGELVEIAKAAERKEWTLGRVLEPSLDRVLPGCPHFGACGGCHVQMASAPEQLRIKQAVLLDWLMRAGVLDLPKVQIHAAEPWGYRNRIRLRVGRDETGALRFGYNGRASRRFLPITTCPISAPLLWRAAETLLTTAAASPELRAWLSASAEVEIFTDATLEHLQLLLLLEGNAPSNAAPAFARAMDALQTHLPELAGAGAVVLGLPQRGRESTRERTRTGVASWGATGLAYSLEPQAMAAEHYWITRGGFFQVNRFLLPELVRLVCAGRAGALAWDLFAGVGLFARVLTHSFHHVIAVEGNPLAARDLQAALTKLAREQGRGPHSAVEAPALEFLQRAVLQRERPDLITLDPPRAGAGEPACELLLRLNAPEIVYVSCDPETLARDLAVLQRGYRVAALHLVDMFPQTYHQEAVVALQRRP